MRVPNPPGTPQRRQLGALAAAVAAQRGPRQRAGGEGDALGRIVQGQGAPAQAPPHDLPAPLGEQVVVARRRNAGTWSARRCAPAPRRDPARWDTRARARRGTGPCPRRRGTARGRTAPARAGSGVCAATHAAIAHPTRRRPSERHGSAARRGPRGSRRGWHQRRAAAPVRFRGAGEHCAGCCGPGSAVAAPAARRRTRHPAPAWPASRPAAPRRGSGARSPERRRPATPAFEAAPKPGLCPSSIVRARAPATCALSSAEPASTTISSGEGSRWRSIESNSTRSSAAESCVTITTEKGGAPAHRPGRLEQGGHGLVGRAIPAQRGQGGRRGGHAGGPAGARRPRRP